VKVLILGKGSFLGRALSLEFEKISTIEWIESKEIDFSNLKSIEKLLKEKRPDYALNCLAIANVDYAEEHPVEATLVNGQFPSFFGAACEQIGSKGIHFSTDYVFDGNKNEPYLETDQPNPLSVYGRTKLQGETHFLKKHPSGLVLRTAWLYGSGKANFISNYLEALKKNKPIRVIDDQIGSPSIINDVANYTNQLKDQSGIFHVVNKGKASRKECLELICQEMEFSKEEQEAIIQPVHLDSLQLLAKRPKFSSLDTTKMDTILREPSRSWQVALKEFVTIPGTTNGFSRGAVHKKEKGCP
jgi:dTDP-4-dehydrorhamnose reductase